MPARQYEMPDPVIRQGDASEPWTSAELASEGGSGAELTQTARVGSDRRRGASGLIAWMLFLAVVGLLVAFWFGGTFFQVMD
jgi:hypothetical protein